MTEDTIKKKLYTFKHKCSLCDYETNKKQDLKKHQLVHANKIWQCTHCNYKTARENNLKSHTKSIHENVRYCGGSCTRNPPKLYELVRG